jgi:hypothetical protein
MMPVMEGKSFDRGAGKNYPGHLLTNSRLRRIF